MRDDDFDVSLELPAEGTLGALLHIQLRVTNRSGALQALRPCFLERHCLRRTSHSLPPTYHGATYVALLTMAPPSTAP